MPLSSLSRLALLVISFSGFLATQQAPVPVEQEPLHHMVLKNDQVEVMRLELPPGESTQFHTHVHDRIAVDLSNATLALEKLNGPEGTPQDTAPGKISSDPAADAPLTHRVRNLGKTAYQVMDVEVLHRPQEPSATAAAEVAAENPSMRVYRWSLVAGAITPMHSHERPYLILAVTPLRLKMAAPNGEAMVHDVKAGDLHWVEAKVTHALGNVGNSEAQIVEIELK